VTRHESTEFSPFFLVHGREARLPIDMDLPVCSDEGERPPFSRLVIARRQAKRNSNRAHEKSKVRFDKDKKNVNFKIGDKVLRSVPVRKKGRTQAFLAQKVGPFEVVEKISVVNYKIKKLKGKRRKPFTVHVRDMIPFVSEFVSDSSDEEVTLPIARRRKERKLSSSSSSESCQENSVVRTTRTTSSSSKSKQASGKSTSKSSRLSADASSIKDIASDAELSSSSSEENADPLVSPAPVRKSTRAKKPPKRLGWSDSYGS